MVRGAGGADALGAVGDSGCRGGFGVGGGSGGAGAAEGAVDAVLSRRDLEVSWLGFSESVVRARILAARQDWTGAARLLSPIAAAGEPDNTSPDRVGTLQLRWLAATAWERAGQPDSARVQLRRLAETTRLTANQFALRGLVLPYAQRHHAPSP